MAVPTTELWNNKSQGKILIQTHQYSAKIYHSSRFDSKKMFFQEIRKRFFFQILAAQARYVRIWTLRSGVALFCTPQPTTRLTTSDAKELVNAGTHQMEPPSPIQALGVNPFPSRFIIRTVPRGDFARRRWEEPITTTKWHCYCTSSNNRKFGVDRPNTIIS